MRNHRIFAPAFAVLALIIALDCANSCDEPQQHPPRPARLLIKCAEASEGMLCWPDPGMLRLEFPRSLPPEAAPPPIVPSR